MPSFNIVCNASNTLAITGSFKGGGRVTLQTLDSTNAAQQWQGFFQIADGWLGTAFVITDNSGNLWSVTSNGTGNQLVMQSFEFNSGDRDSWLLADLQDGGICRMQYPADFNWSWNDFGGGFLPGDKVGLYSDTNNNSLWQIINFIDAPFKPKA
jgi:hypothetical protein